jgi:hypothetical protein
MEYEDLQIVPDPADVSFSHSNESFLISAKTNKIFLDVNFHQNNIYLNEIFRIQMRLFSIKHSSLQ